MFTNPKGLAAARRQNTAGFSIHGAALWDAIAAEGSHGREFHLRDVRQWIAESCGLAPRTATRYIVAFIAYAKACPEDFSGPASRVVQEAKGVYRLVDAPED